MAVTKKTPGVYIQEISVFPPAIAAVSTAVPVFIGYTDKEDNKFEAKKINSLLDFEQKYCDWDSWKLTFTVKESKIEEDFSRNELYYHMRLYFANGGGRCYVISLGNKRKNSSGRKDEYQDALKVLEKEDEPTLILFPEAAELPFPSCMEIYQEALAQAAKLQDRFVIMDVPERENEDNIKEFRNGIGTNNLKYGAAYYPYLKTNVSRYSMLSNENISFKDLTTEEKGDKKTKSMTNIDVDPGSMDRKNMIRFIKSHTLTMPPSAAIAGVYATVDSTRGVWKAPANVSLNSVAGVTQKVTHEEQADLNVDAQSGKSINAIRSFEGRGIMVWGARTLAGNDNEWRYVNVRRFYNFVEESVQKATRQFVFEPNDANTWVRVSTMIENFLTNLWRQGALAGATPEEAFFVKVGLGTTMTFDDVLNGIMNVEIGLAVVRPAEFIILKFSQKMQES